MPKQVKYPNHHVGSLMLSVVVALLAPCYIRKGSCKTIWSDNITGRIYSN